MKLKMLLENGDDTLIGRKINGIIVEPDMKIWEREF